MANVHYRMLSKYYSNGRRRRWHGLDPARGVLYGIALSVPLWGVLWLLWRFL